MSPMAVVLLGRLPGWKSFPAISFLTAGSAFGNLTAESFLGWRPEGARVVALGICLSGRNGSGRISVSSG